MKIVVKEKLKKKKRSSQKFKRFFRKVLGGKNHQILEGLR